MKTIVILGMHRSGTSAIAGFLATVGFNVGKTLLPTNEYNEKGYFESRLIVDAHDRLLESLGHTWHDIRPLPQDWLQHPITADSKKQLTDIFQLEFGGVQPLVMKDPRLCRLLPLWQDIFDSVGVEPCYVMVLRKPEEVAASLWRRDGMPANKAMLLYVAYLLDAERYTRQFKRVVVCYTDLLQDWVAVLAKLDAAFGLQLSELAPAVVEQVTQFLSPSLKHFSAGPGQQAGQVDVAAQLAERLYTALAAPNPQTDRELDDIRAAFDQHLASLEPWLSEAALLNRVKQEIVRPGPQFHAIMGQGATAQLFWRDVAGRITEAQSVRVPFVYGEGVQCLRFVLPDAAKRIGGLRLDISNRPASCDLVGLRVEDAQGSLVWQWSAGTPLFEHCSADMSLPGGQDASEVLSVIATGGDPYAMLCIPPPVVAQLAPGWTVAVDVVVSLLSASVPPLLNRVAKQRQALADARVAMQELEQKLAATTTLATVQHEQCRVEILRAAAQIEMLKDLWLSDRDGANML